jgi:hypothetical protein
MLHTQPQRTFLKWGEGQKGRNAYTQAFALARDADPAFGTDAPSLNKQPPIAHTKEPAPKHAPPQPKTEAQVLNEELLGNDSLGG